MDEKTFNLILNSRSVRSVHHRVAVEAVKFLDENMANLFLKHYEQLLEGAKAPDKKFKDYRNHVYHMPDRWGGAPKAVNEWFNKTVTALSNQKWEEAIYAAGVMSHYFADINHPFHTGQTDEEGLIHSFTEWGAAEIYPELRKTMKVEQPQTIKKIKDFVASAANEANKSYVFMLENYDVEQGQNSSWGKGYNTELREDITLRIASAIQGTAALLLKAINEAGNPDPGVIKLNGKRFMTRFTMPAEWIRRYREKRNRKRKTRKMKKEYQKTKRVLDSLLPDDKDYMKALHEKEFKPMKLPKALKSIESPPVKKEPKITGLPKLNYPKKSRYTPVITLTSPIDDAAEVGKATADKLKKIGIIKVSDFISKKPKAIVKLLNEKLDYKQLDVAEVTRMRAETIIMLEVWRLHVHDAVILNKAGIRTKSELKKQKKNKLWKAVQVAIKDKHVKKFLRRSNLLPDLEEVEEWIQAAKE